MCNEYYSIARFLGRFLADIEYRHTVAWIASLPIKLAPAMIMLDIELEAPTDFIQPMSDTNVYTHGSIRKHNAVIA